MSEAFSLYVRLDAAPDAVDRALASVPTALVPDAAWRAWWDSRDMVGGTGLAEVPPPSAAAARTQLTQLIEPPDRSGFFAERDGGHAVIGVPLCTENYRHLAALAALFDHVACASAARGGALLVFDALWGSNDVMLFATADAEGLHPTTARTLADVDPAFAATAVEQIARRVDALARRTDP